VLGVEFLKDRIEITEKTVECPVRNCNEKVERQRRTFKKETRFKCPKHDIYISPSTFEYSCYLDNMIWKEKDDLDLLNQISMVKRESRMARDNSEDAVTWNVFRFLEKDAILNDLLKNRLNIVTEDADIIYWSYSQCQAGLWDHLREAREEFELTPAKGSEPDLIIMCSNDLAFIEAKLTALNETQPTNMNVENKYVTGGEHWWREVFRSDFYDVAVRDRKYELSRFWLLGSWIAERLGLNFHLINLTRSEQEKDIKTAFEKHIKMNEKRAFARLTWESIRDYILRNVLDSHNREVMIWYFRNKTIGYDRYGKLRRAFLDE